MKIGFIGFGHMAGAMAKGLIRSGYCDARDIYACASDYDKLCKRLAEGQAEEIYLRGVRPLATATEVAQESNVVFITVKPKDVKAVIEPIIEDLVGRVVISVAFGLDFNYYEELFAGNQGATIRHLSIIPNTPCEVCRGITICEDKHNLEDPELETVMALLGALGETESLSSDKMWLAGEVSSCGPAFAAMFIEALGDGAAKYGLDKETAYRVVSAMVEGTGLLQRETEKLPGDMVTEVATPGGVTIKGVTALREAKFNDIVISAIDAIEAKK